MQASAALLPQVAKQTAKKQTAKAGQAHLAKSAYVARTPSAESWAAPRAAPHPATQQPQKKKQEKKGVTGARWPEQEGEHGAQQARQPDALP